MTDLTSITTDMADIEQIIRDWRDEFPLLNSYTRSSLFMRTDMVLIGLRIDKSDIFPECYGIRNSYGLILEILPLWKEDKKERAIPIFSVMYMIKEGSVHRFSTGMNESLKEQKMTF